VRRVASPAPRRPLDLLRLPLLGTFLRWRHARTTLQTVCLALAVVILLDGFFGPQLAPRNLAGVLPWVHWRGFVVLALLVVGNLFCMACPFMLPRRLAKRFLPADRSWPRLLRSKWLAVALLLVFFWAYEAYSLWASPWLTAWVAGAYFLGAFAVDGFFRGAAFCRWVCPIGQFHFVHAMASPFEVRVRDAEVCGRCTTKDCIRGRYAGGAGADPGSGSPVAGTGSTSAWAGRPLAPDPVTGRLALAGTGAGAGGVAASGQARGRAGLLQRGCELALYLPKKEGNLDCTFCMECIQACPHDNVGIVARSPLRDMAATGTRSGVGRIQARPDLAALALLLVYAAFLNALGMVEPVYRLQAWGSATLGIPSREVLLALFFAVGLVLVPLLLTGVTAWASRRLASSGGSLVATASRYAWGLVPLGLGMWAAHYLFHFLVGALTVVPVVQQYLADLGLPAGEPGWGLGAVVPESWLLPVKLILLQGGLLLALAALWRIAQGAVPGAEARARRRAGRAFLPWAILATGLAGAGIWLLLQPMEMRGTFMAPGPLSLLGPLP
jgi:polyferredoxin